MRNFTRDEPTEAEPLAYFPFSWSLVTLVLGVVTFLGNLLTAVVFWKRRSFLRRTTYLLVNLAVADLLVGVGITMSSLASIFKEANTEGIVWLLIEVTTVPTNASIFSLVLVAMERLLAVARPLRHRTTKTRYYFYAVFVAWLVASFILVVLLLYYPFYILGREVGYIMTGFQWASLILICLCYGAIWCWFTSKRPQQAQQRQQNKKLAKTLLIITAISLITWLPSEVLLTVREILPSSVYSNLIIFAWCAAISNSLLNPFVYALRMPEFRREAAKLLFCRRNHHGIEDGLPMANM